MKNLTERKEWLALIAHQQSLADHHLRDWFVNDLNRSTRLTVTVDELALDYSRNRINDDTIHLLCELAHACDLSKKIEALFSGYPINETENRPALHTALRNQHSSSLLVKNHDIIPLIQQTKDKMHHFIDRIYNGHWHGVTGKPIAHIVNVGIGGSYIGPMFCTDALKEFAITPLKFHFISSIDKAHLNEILQRIDLETTLFIISSKSFTTLETLTNARTIFTYLKDKLGNDAINQHVVAVTAATEKAIAFGIPETNIFPIWDWIGGRYSIWSAVGLPLLLLIGKQHFADFLEGAYSMDQHFKHTPFQQNMPVLLALLGIWYTNFFGTQVQAIIPYAHRLRYFVPYLQQAEMESNGKSVNTNGAKLTYTTSPVLVGEEGILGQHAYHQLLHQGQHLIPVDFILVNQTSQLVNAETDYHHDILLASALSQAQALMQGKTFEEAYNELIELQYHPAEAAQLAKHKCMPGNRPSNIIHLEKLTPKNLGALIALYEHKIFVQGIIWGINSFDQWGVELGKQLLPAILRRIQEKHREKIACD